MDVDKDLAPVCPNCHYMLHRKDPPYTIEELKEMLSTHDVKTEIKPAVASKRSGKQKAQSVRFQSDATVLKDVNADGDVRRLIHNMMEIGRQFELVPKQTNGRCFRREVKLSKDVILQVAIFITTKNEAYQTSFSIIYLVVSKKSRTFVNREPAKPTHNAKSAGRFVL